MPTNQNRAPYALAFAPSLPTTSPVTLAMSTATTFLALGFVSEAGKTLANVRAYISATAGTLIAGDVTCSLYSDSGLGVPSSAIEAKNCATAPSGAGWYNWTGFTTALTAGTQYWLVFKNLNGTPGTNFPTFRNGGSSTLPHVFSGSSTYGWPRKHATDGTTYGAPSTPAGGWRVGYSDGSYEGTPYESVAIATDKVYGTREHGVKLTLPPTGLTYNIRGLSFFFFSSWSGALGDVGFRIYTGTNTPLSGGAAATTIGGITKNNTASGAYFVSYFSSPVAVSGGSVIRATMAVPAGTGSSSNHYDPYEYTFDSDSNSLPLLPLGAVKTYWDGTGPSWADTTNVLPMFGILLDSDTPFSVAGGGGGGGMLVSPGMGGW